MELNINTQGEKGYLKKYLFNSKTQRSDGLLIQVNHSFSDSFGGIKKYRFVHSSFNDVGTYLALSDHKGNVFIIDLEMEKYWQLPNIGLISLISFPVFNKQGILLGLDTASIVLCNIDTGCVSTVLNGHSVPAIEASYTNDGYYCLTSCHAEAIVWDLSCSIQIHRLSLKPNASLKKVVFMPLSNYILTCFQDDTMHVWQFGTFECIKQIIPETCKSHHLKDVAFTRNGRAMVIGGQSPNLVIFCLDTWTIKKVIEFPENISGIKQLEFVPQVFDGGANKILTVLTTSQEIYFFNIETSTFLGGMQLIFGMTNKIAVNNTGRYLATILTTGEVKIYGIEKILSYNEILENGCNNEKRPLNNDSNLPSRNKCNRSRRMQKSGQSSIKRQLNEVLDLKKLQPILKQFGEYPESYRILIWKTILQLPENQTAFFSLSTKPLHASYTNLDTKYPLVNKSLCNALKKLLSNLTHWCPLFSEVNFIAEFVFPFVKVFHSDPMGCFEVMATIIVNWCQNWFEFYPFPPINMLSLLESTLGHHDPELMEFYLKNNITSSVSVCPLFHTAFSEVLSKTDWLKLWDHVLSNEPAFLFMAIIAYNVVNRNAIKCLKNSEDIEKYFRKQNPVDLKMLISKTYLYLRETPEEIHCRNSFIGFRPLTSNSYQSFLAYPKLIVDSNVERLQIIRKEEEDILEERMKALKIKQTLEKKLKPDSEKNGQEKIYKEVEDKIRQVVEDEEERLISQRQKLRNLKQELLLKELEVLESTRQKVLKEKQEKKELELERLIHDISKRKARESTEVDVMEEEIHKYYADLLLKKYQLEFELWGMDCDDDSKHEDLEYQRQKFQKDLSSLQKEWGSLQSVKQTEILWKMNSIKRFMKELEKELAKKMTEKEATPANPIGLQRLKNKVQNLERQIEKLFAENLDNIYQQREDSKLTKWQSVFTENSSLRGRREDSFTRIPSTGMTSKSSKKKLIKIPKKLTAEKANKKPEERNAFPKGVVTKKRQETRVGNDGKQLKQNSLRPGIKLRSKLTCKKKSRELPTARDVTGDSGRQIGMKGGAFPEPDVVCHCKTDKRIDPGYEFESDSVNEIFKSVLRTRKQLIKEARQRQRPH